MSFAADQLGLTHVTFEQNAQPYDDLAQLTHDYIVVENLYNDAGGESLLIVQLSIC